MKLKLRFLISLISATLIAVSLIATVTRYFYSSDYPIHEEDTHDEVAVTKYRKSLQNREFNQFIRIQMPPPTKKIKKAKNKKKHHKRRFTAKNVTYADSNQAAEVQLSEKELELLLKNKEILKPSTSPDHKLVSRPSSRKEFKSRFLRECVNAKLISDLEDDREGFEDLVEIIQEEKSSFEKKEQTHQRNRITIQDIHGIELLSNLTLMEHFHLGISDQDLYKEDDMLVPSLLKEMSNSRIVHVEEKAGGTQLKLMITFYDGSQALMKPMRQV